MSWSGFKKNVGRATTQVMMKTGHVEKTSDREYEVEERRFRQLETASLKLQKEAKGYLDSLRAMTASQMRIAETIDAFYGDSGARDGVSRSYKQAVEDLDAETIKALDGPYRCVPHDLHRYAWQEQERRIGEKELAYIEWQMNQGRLHTQAAQINHSCKQYVKLMDFVYRTTVLEPINRFCAYFSDINECIKKRNHKMVDYDGLRSKVKKLTEKPDKDASKLPRTEKELEMVSAIDFLTDGVSWSSKRATNPPILAKKFFIPRRAATHAGPIVPKDDVLLDLLDIPSPPKILPTKLASARSIGANIHVTPMRARDSGCFGPSIAAMTLGRSAPSNPIRSVTGSFSGAGSTTSLSPSRMNLISFRRNDSTRSRSSQTSPSGRRSITATPFFNPSELEEIMRPVKEDFLKREADQLAQAKQAYDQLNEQLTTELPQLIDLRVPYLDPSFEALVKIQLRFCAEAYSRMAQVQQYLDASTRDQYASGELDAKVEDVLGQIRELSIAGTV